MTNSLIFALIVLACVVLGVIGCAPNRRYRINELPYTQPLCKAGTDPDNQSMIETTPDYNLGFVEFDEEGWFWSRKQVKEIKKMIKEQGGVGETNRPAGIIIVVFVHGWKNNTQYNCGNVSTFRQTLQYLNQAEKAAAQTAVPVRNARKVVGVYCGWRGLSATIEPFKELSMWKRKTTAHRVGSYGAMTQLFVELQELGNASKHELQTNAPRTELIIVGHSFGGAAVYSAVCQFMTEGFVTQMESGQRLKPLGDQIILLNPAFEASRHHNLYELAKTIKRFPADQRPVLSILTSEGDWATHYFMPIGRFLSTPFERTHSKEERQATRTAVGWFRPFVTHNLIYDTNAVFGTNTHTTYERKTRRHRLLDMTQLEESTRNVRAQRDNWRPNAEELTTYGFDDCKLQPRHKFREGNPFMIVSVDKRIMKDHDDISNPVLINFLREYIQFCHEATPAKLPGGLQTGVPAVHLEKAAQANAQQMSTQVEQEELAKP